MKRKNRPTAKLIIAPNSLLTTVCEVVKDGEDVSSIVRDMMHILINSITGIGLAAPQAGHLKRIILVLHNGFSVGMINPEIVFFGGIEKNMQEVCLSYPGISKELKRYTYIKVNYIDEKGNQKNGTFIDLQARIIQHEINHLDGKCPLGEK